MSDREDVTALDAALWHTEAEPTKQVAPMSVVKEAKYMSNVNTTEARTGFCVKCKTKRAINNPQPGTLKNDRPVLRGTCAVCGTGVIRFLSAKEG